MEMATTRHSAAERRDDVLDAAMIEFAEHGYEGTSTEDIARRAGISQPYLFRLFGTKKELFKASSSRCMRETLEMFQRAAEGKRGEEALHAMGTAYIDELLTGDRVRLRAQMQAYSACDDPEICEVVRNGYGDLVAYAQRVSGLPSDKIWHFFATGMMLNVLASMQVHDGAEPWAQMLLEGCGKDIG
ncbi:MAG TPA: TetR/AcrR family transcriptional regulator [Gaiellaceae bacterium]|nr:TetR/AcrR family transcriptional regulator [Gaiellaceae bacterium]